MLLSVVLVGVPMTFVAAMSWDAPLDGRAKKKCKLEEYQDPRLAVSPPQSLSSSIHVSQGTKKGTQQCITNEEVDQDGMGDYLLDTRNIKRKLTVEQVKFLEASFNMDLKLEPERKALIAQKLGIRPRQVAIWFQNRRARWKLKQLEQEYETLRTLYQIAMQEKENSTKKHELAIEENKKLQVEVARLKNLLQGMEDSAILNVVANSNDQLVKSKKDWSGKSEAESSTKSSYVHCEMQDSDQSYASQAFGLGSYTGDDIHPVVSFVGKLEIDDSSFPPTCDFLGSLVQHIVANDFGLEEANISCIFEQ